MSEKITQWATALSAIVAAVSLVVSLNKYFNDENQKKIEAWQKVAVYELILSEKKANFQELKVGYVVEAQQIQSFNLPSDKIQDDALRKVLLELQSVRLIRYRDDMYYEPILATKQPSKFEMMALLQKQAERQNLFPLVQTKILDILNRECGTINNNELHRLVSESIDISFPLFFEMLNSMRGYQVHKLDDGTWCTTYDEKKEEIEN